MIAYSASGRVNKGLTIVAGKPEELDWLIEQLQGVEGARRNTHRSATAPLTKMKELQQQNPSKIVAVS
ncbi:MAG: hypothetical protein Q7T05_01295 [Dehalococcoidia bacterium]|nr:hypothetical protein [Dehalococcoidia bacterium]